MNRSNEELDALAQRLCRLPEPPVPGELEGKLLAAIPEPAQLEARSRRLLGQARFGAGMAAAVVLAFFLGYLAGSGGRMTKLTQSQPQGQTAEERRPEAPLPSRASAGFVSLSSSFEWPVSATLSVSAHRLPEDLTE
jgi:hypothetical protein